MIVKKVIRQKTDKSSFKRLVNYLTTDKGIEHRVAAVNLTNLENDDLFMCIKEVEVVQDMNKRTTKDKTYHFIFSFPEGERPDLDSLKEIEDRFVKALGYEDHQRISVIHGDTDNYHVHVAINKIHPITHHAIEPKNDFFKLSQERKLVEKVYGLINTDKQKKFCHKSNDIEKLRNVQSLVGYVKNNCLNVFEKSMSWEDLQKGLLEYGLKIKQRGNGMVVATTDDRLFIKLSSVDRKISKNNLIEKLGKFKGVDNLGIDINSITQISTYREDFLNFSSQSTKLYEAYKKEQSNNIYIRNKELSWLKNNREREIKAIRVKYKRARKLVKLMGGNPVLMKLAYKLLYSQMKSEIKLSNSKYKSQKSDIYNKHKNVNWNEYLIDKAKAGDNKALDLLRNKRVNFQRNEYLENSIGGEIRDNNDVSYLRKTIDHITKNGTILVKGFDNDIRVKESGVFLGNNPSFIAIEKSLLISINKFGYDLDIKGDTEFKAAVILIAKKNNLDVFFKDNAMNTLYNQIRERDVIDGRGKGLHGTTINCRERINGFRGERTGREGSERDYQLESNGGSNNRGKGREVTSTNCYGLQKTENETNGFTRITNIRRTESRDTSWLKYSLPLLPVCDMDGFRKGTNLLLPNNLSNNVGSKEKQGQEHDYLRRIISRASKLDPKLDPPANIILNNHINNSLGRKK